jgi:hypothetical protein
VNKGKFKLITMDIQAVDIEDATMVGLILTPSWGLV